MSLCYSLQSQSSHYFFFLPSFPHHPHPLSFPTRRSSDLPPTSRASRRSPPPRGCPGRWPRGTPEWTRNSPPGDRKSTRLNSSHVAISYAVFCLKKKKMTLYPPIKHTKANYYTHGTAMQQQ